MTTARNKPAPKPVKAWAMMNLDEGRPHVHQDWVVNKPVRCWSLYRSRAEAKVAARGAESRQVLHHVAPCSHYAVVDKAKVAEAMRDWPFSGQSIAGTALHHALRRLGLLPPAKPAKVKPRAWLYTEGQPTQLVQPMKHLAKKPAKKGHR